MLADLGVDALLGFVVVSSSGDLTRVVIETRFLGLLEGDVVGSARELLLDDLELAEDELDFANLPLGLIVGRTLIVLAAEEGPVGDVAGTRLVAAKVVGDDLARQVLGVLASHAASVLVVHAEELALGVGYVFIVVERLITRGVVLGLYSVDTRSVYAFNGEVVTPHIAQDACRWVALHLRCRS